MPANFNGSYSQNFDNLATSGTSNTWTNDTTLNGWFLYRQPAPGTAITTYGADTGSSNGGNFYSYGSTGSTDRALGGLASGGTYFGSPASGAVAGWIAFAATNTTGATINSLNVAFNGEQWRNGGNTTAQSMVLEYGFGTSFTTVSTWNAPGSNFNWTSPVATSTGAAVDGNAAGRVSGRGGTLSNLNWASNDTLWFRWIENNDTANDHGLAIDDFSLSVNSPLPTVAIAATDPNAAETGQDPGTFRITRTGDTTNSLTVNYTVSGTSTNGTDYTLTLTGTATIAAGQSFVDITITPVDDAVIEGNETVILTLSTSANYTVGTASDTVTIADNDAPATPTVNLSVSANAGTEAGTTIITVTATASSAVSGNQTVTLGVSGTGITTSDYYLSNTTITIPNGQTSGSVSFIVADDAIVEGTETAVLTISNPSAGINLGATTSQNITITNNNNSFLTKVGGATSANGAEIPAFDPGSDRLFVVAGNTVEIYTVSNTGSLATVGSLTLGITPPGGTELIPNSVAVKNGIVAVAYAIRETATGVQQIGQVGFYNAATGAFLNSVAVGALPDMLTFTPDGTRVLVANEGEPNSYNQGNSVDPEGSVSIINIANGVANATVQTATFTSFNSQLTALRDAGVRIFGPNATVAQDLEPEYIAVAPDGLTARITLQENNAVAILDIASATITNILPLGAKNHNLPGNGIDASDQNGGINILNWPVFGLYQPDAIASFTVNGQTYYITANEGDARDYTGFAEELRVGNAGYVLDPTIFPNAATLKQNANLGRLTVTNATGDTDGDGDFDRIEAFGARSFSIWDANGNQVFDSGNQLEQITATRVPTLFNSDGLAATFDTRSDNKGPEPEGVTVGVINGRTYAFIGLERTGDVIVYDVTNPIQPQFVQYINTPEDVAPEGLTFISATDSPTGKPLLVVANEVSRTVAVFEITLPGVTITESGGSTNVTEGGATDTYTVVLNSQPTSHVTINLNPGSQLTTNTNTLTFTTDDWNIAQTVTVTAVDDAVVEGNHTGTIQHTATSSDSSYNAFAITPVTVNIADNDVAFPGATPGQDILRGTAGNDIIDALDGNDYIFGNAGDDTLDGGNGTDYVFGGDGNDTVSGGDGSDFLYGNVGNDLLFGGEGGDNLDGGEGDDGLEGGAGNDIYTVDSLGDQVIEAAGGGIDKINSAITWDLTNSSNVENLTLLGNTAIDGTGNELNNHIVGNNAINILDGGEGDDWLMGKAGDDHLIGGNGNDRLDGGVGNDLLEGGAGNDIYEVDSDQDQIIEVIDAGTDTVFSLVSWDLGDNLENLSLVGNQAINGQGNNVDNRLMGNSADNILEGLAGNDQLFGGAGNDTLRGGLGSDRLEGGLGADIFDLTGVLNSGWDSLVDFKVGEDIVHLSASEFGLSAGTLNPSLFGLGTSATTGNQRFIYNQAKGELFFDADGSGSNAQMQIALFSNRAALTANSFLLIGNAAVDVIINQSGGNTTITEDGVTDSYSVVLSNQPTSNVVINLNSGTQLTTNTNQLVFTPQNWNVAQTVTVIAIDDSFIEENHSGMIQHTVSSSDSRYNGIAINSINVSINDNDIPLTRNGNSDIFTIKGSNAQTRLKVSLTDTGAYNADGSAFSINELGLFIVDDAQGRINGLLPGEAGYTQAALSRVQVILSGVPDFPGQISGDRQRLLELNSGSNFRFYLVRNSSLDNVNQGTTPVSEVLFGTPSTQQIIDLGSSVFSIAWEDGTNNTLGSNPNDFLDLVVTIENTNQPLTLGTGLQTITQGELLDLRTLPGTVEAEFIVTRDGLLDDYIGFYRVANENGGIDINGDSVADVNPGDPNYIQTAVSSRVAGIDLTVSTTPGTATYQGSFLGGAIYAPFMIANGRPSAFSDANTANDPPVYFPYLGANADGRDHIRLLGDNYFGFEDLPLGNADFDSNDFTLKTNFSIIN